MTFLVVVIISAYVLALGFVLFKIVEPLFFSRKGVSEVIEPNDDNGDKDGPVVDKPVDTTDDGANPAV